LIVIARILRKGKSGDSTPANQLQMYLFQKYARMKLKDIGADFGEG
jgi:chromosomal replication initiation ATPase DnaA